MELQPFIRLLPTTNESSNTFVTKLTNCKILRDICIRYNKIEFDGIVVIKIVKNK
jgi:hypothetical protein